MSQLTLEFLVESLTGHPIEGQAHPISDVVFDSREAGPGALFAALPGEHTDGHEYVGAALQRGALAALVERSLDLPYPLVDLREGGPVTHLPPTPLLLWVENVLQALQTAARRWSRRWVALSGRRIIGITGSVGKTSTKELVADVLARRYPTLRSRKSYNNEIGIPVTVLKLSDQHQRAVLEMSMYVTGEIALLCDIAPPQVGVVTLVAPVHLERAGSMENIIAAKSELVRALPPAPQGTAILNMDDPNVLGMAQLTQARVLTYGLNPQADVWADRIEGLGLEGIRFRLHHGADQFILKLPLLGRHSVHTALAATAVGLTEGLTWDEIITGLQTSRNQLRLLAVEGPNGSIILDDTYNASPPSMLAALNLLADLGQGQRIAVLGDMLELGSYEERGHRDVGARAAAVVDLLITVGERGRIIADEAIRCGLPTDRVYSLSGPDEAAQLAWREARSGDVILVKGSRAVGMEQVVRLLTTNTERES